MMGFAHHAMVFIRWTRHSDKIDEPFFGRVFMILYIHVLLYYIFRHITSSMIVYMYTYLYIIYTHYYTNFDIGIL